MAHLILPVPLLRIQLHGLTAKKAWTLFVCPGQRGGDGCGWTSGFCHSAGKFTGLIGNEQT